MIPAFRVLRVIYKNGFAGAECPLSVKETLKPVNVLSKAGGCVKLRMLFIINSWMKCR